MDDKANAREQSPGRKTLGNVQQGYRVAPTKERTYNSKPVVDVIHGNYPKEWLTDEIKAKYKVGEHGCHRVLCAIADRCGIDGIPYISVKAIANDHFDGDERLAWRYVNAISEAGWIELLDRQRGRKPKVYLPWHTHCLAWLKPLQDATDVDDELSAGVLQEPLQQPLQQPLQEPLQQPLQEPLQDATDKPNNTKAENYPKQNLIESKRSMSNPLPIAQVGLPEVAWMQLEQQLLNKLAYGNTVKKHVAIAPLQVAMSNGWTVAEVISQLGKELVGITQAGGFINKLRLVAERKKFVPPFCDDPTHSDKEAPWHDVPESPGLVSECPNWSAAKLEQLK